MALDCTAPPLDGPFASSALAFVDCQSRALGAAGFQALAMPGSSIAALLGGALTLFIALIGYRLLTGEMPARRQLLGWAMRVGVVLTLATSWSAVRVLVFDVATAAPAQLAAEITRPLRLASIDGDLPDQVQALSDAMDQLIMLTPAQPSASAAPPLSQSGQSPGPAAAAAPPAAQPPASVPPGFRIDLAQPVPAARAIFLLTALGALAALHAAIGLLIALLPLFACTLLFDATRGLFAGWVRAILGAALGMLAAGVVVGIEVAVLAPMLQQLLTLPDTGGPPAIAAGNLLLTTLLFAAALAGTLWAVARASAGFTFPAWAAAPRTEREQTPDPVARAPAAAWADAPSAGVPSRANGAARAVRVADALRAAERREAASASAALGSRVTPLGAAGAATVLDPVPLGQSSRRFARGRVSASAQRRDRQA